MPIKSNETDSMSSYKNRYDLQDKFTIEMHRLIETLLVDNGINFHLIDKRTKSIESFTEKISRLDKTYSSPLSEITDLTGIRIIVYYNDDVDKVVDLLKEQFIIDKERSNDGRDNLNPNEFGYLSTHLIIKLSTTREKLFDWKKYKELCAEIQIRTVLQHSWSSISHALQYKTQNSVPNALKRQLSRLAGLFEIADDEFMSIRDKHRGLTSANEAKGSGELMISEIDVLSLTKYINESEVVQRIFEKALNSGFIDMDEREDNEGFNREGISSLIEMCFYCDINKINLLDEVLSQNNINMVNVFTSIRKRYPHIHRWFIHKSMAVSVKLATIYIIEIDTQTLVSLGWSKDYAKIVIDAIQENLK